MTKPEVVLSSGDIKKTIGKISQVIIKNCPDFSKLALIGIRNRGVPLAKRIKEELETTAHIRGVYPEERRAQCKHNSKIDIPLGTLDITLYRDDLETVGPAPVVKSTDVNFDLTDKIVILVDDVLFTGRTIRSALTELLDFGRPRCIQLAVLIDRGHRELPVQADYVGKVVNTARSQIIQVKLKETDGRDEVILK